MDKYYHYTNEEGYEGLIKAGEGEGHFRPSGILDTGAGDINYGTGWYVTSLPPSTSTEEILLHLWNSDPTKRDRTTFWIEISVREYDVRIPDPDRPFVALIPYYRQKASVEGSIYGSGSGISLTAGGTRSEDGSGAVEVTALFRSEGTSIYPSFIAAITGVRGMHWVQRQFLMNRYKIKDSDDSFNVRKDSLIDQSDMLFRRGEFSRALDVIEEALDLDPESTIVWSNKGAILAALGRREDAIFAYQRALEISPTNVSALRNASANLIRLERYSEALELCEKALSHEPQNGELWTNRGTIHQGLGEEEEALEAFDKAVELDPGIAQAWNNRAGIIAQRALKSIASLKRGESEASDLLRTSELVGTAIDSYVRAIECSPDYQNAKDGLRFIAGIALERLPHTWKCEDSLWRATTVDEECLGAFILQFSTKKWEYHPRYLPIVRSKGYAISDARAIMPIIMEAHLFLMKWDWDTKDLLEPDNARIQIGTLLLADILGRCGLVKLALRLGELVSEIGKGSTTLEDGTLLQIAKSLAGAGISLRQAEAYDEAVEVYEQAREIYRRCGDQKFTANMTYNIGAAYAWRRDPGDLERAKAIFQESFRQYQEGGFRKDYEDAVRDAQGLLKSPIALGAAPSQITPSKVAKLVEKLVKKQKK